MRLLNWIKDKYKHRRDGQVDHDPWWVSLLLDVGRPVVAVMILIMCAPGEHYLAVQAGWSQTLAWGMPGTLTAYAGIAAVVATKRPKGAPGRKTAISGAVISIALAMAAQPIAHLYGRNGLFTQEIALTIAAGLIPAAVFGHLLHMGAAAPKPADQKPVKRFEMLAWYSVTGTPVPLSMIKRKIHSPVVYLIQNGNRVKIGTTQNITKRIKVLTLSYDNVRCVLHGGQLYERDLHARFAADRIGTTEWFVLSRQLDQFMRDPLSLDKPDSDQSPRTEQDTKPVPVPPQSKPPVRQAADGSMRGFALSLLRTDPDMTNDDLRTSILDRFGSDSKPNSVWRSIQRARADMERTG